MTSSFKEIILIAIGSLILVETTANSKVHCNPTILRHDKRLNCVFIQNWALYDPGDLGKCTCSGRPCMTLSHASVECNLNTNWSLVNDNPTANAWGVGCKDENSCPRCLIPQADFSKCYMSSTIASEFVCVCRHDQREYNVWCQHNGTLDIKNPRDRTKCENPNFAAGGATELSSSSPFSATQKTQKMIESNETTSKLSEKEWFEETIFIAVVSIIALIAISAIIVAILVIIKRRRTSRPVIL